MCPVRFWWMDAGCRCFGRDWKVSRHQDLIVSPSANIMGLWVKKQEKPGREDPYLNIYFGVCNQSCRQHALVCLHETDGGLTATRNPLSENLSQWNVEASQVNRPVACLFSDADSRQRRWCERRIVKRGHESALIFPLKNTWLPQNDLISSWMSQGLYKSVCLPSW